MSQGTCEKVVDVFHNFRRLIGNAIRTANSDQNNWHRFVDGRAFPSVVYEHWRGGACFPNDFSRVGRAKARFVLGSPRLEVVRYGKAKMPTKTASLKKHRVTELGGETPTNGAEPLIEMEIPYAVEVTVQGTADILFHRWNVEAVDEKSKAKKGSQAKKTDNLESYVYRNEKGELCIPGSYIRGAIVNAAKFRQDPRSPRKSAMDLFKAGIVSLTTMASTGLKKWDYEDKQRVVIQRSAITRTRPALKAGWAATFQLMVNLPEYISPSMLNEVIGQAGKLIGLADFRPTYGRFQVVRFKVVELN